MRRHVETAGWMLLPAVSYLLVRLAADPTPTGRFQAGLAALVAGVAVGAFGGADTPLRAGARLLGASVLVGLVQALAGGADGAFPTAFLVLGTSVAAAGLAALGRRLGTPGIPSGAVAACTLWVAMGGLFWADPVSEALPRVRQRPFRQAVLHVDPALALAYDGAGFDRLRSDDVYFEVPLASSIYDRPGALPTGSAWLVFGLVGWGAARIVGRAAPREGKMGGRRRSPAPSPPRGAA